MRINAHQLLPGTVSLVQKLPPSVAKIYSYTEIMGVTRVGITHIYEADLCKLPCAIVYCANTTEHLEIQTNSPYKECHPVSSVASYIYCHGLAVFFSSS